MAARMYPPAPSCERRGGYLVEPEQAIRAAYKATLAAAGAANANRPLGRLATAGFAQLFDTSNAVEALIVLRRYPRSIFEREERTTR